MNNLDKVAFYQAFNNYKTPLKNLPHEVLPIILKFLDERGMQAAIQVSRTFCATVLTVAKPKELELLQSYIQFLCANLPDKFDNIRKDLVGVSAVFNPSSKITYVKISSTEAIDRMISGLHQLTALSCRWKFQEAITLGDVKNSLCPMNTLIYQLFDDQLFDDADLETLQTLEAVSKDIKKPEILTTILYEIIIKTKIRMAKHKGDFEEMEKLFKELLNQDYLKIAIKIIYFYNPIPSNSLIRTISKDIISKGNVDKAIMLIQSLMDTVTLYPEGYNELLSRIALDLFLQGNHDKFLEIVKMIDLTKLEDKSMIVQSTEAILKLKQIKKILAFLESYRLPISWLFKPMWH